MAKKTVMKSCKKSDKKSDKKSNKEVNQIKPFYVYVYEQPPLIPPIPKRQLGTCGSTNMNAINELI